MAEKVEREKRADDVTKAIAKVLGISPAYLSYMVNGKRPWRSDVNEKYLQLC